MIFRLSEWQSPTGYWHCGCTDDLAHDSGAWYLPARILNLAPAQYIKLVLEEYKPDDYFLDADKCLFFFSWKSQIAEARFRNYINKKAREVGFTI